MPARQKPRILLLLPGLKLATLIPKELMPDKTSRSARVVFCFDASPFKQSLTTGLATLIPQGVYASQNLLAPRA
jgi:hypothetical protein